MANKPDTFPQEYIDYAGGKVPEFKSRNRYMDYDELKASGASTPRAVIGGIAGSLTNAFSPFRAKDGYAYELTPEALDADFNRTLQTRMAGGESNDKVQQRVAQQVAVEKKAAQNNKPAPVNLQSPVETQKQAAAPPPNKPSVSNQNSGSDKRPAPALDTELGQGSGSITVLNGPGTGNSKYKAGSVLRLSGGGSSGSFDPKAAANTIVSSLMERSAGSQPDRMANIERMISENMQRQNEAIAQMNRPWWAGGTPENSNAGRNTLAALQNQAAEMQKTYGAALGLEGQMFGSASTNDLYRNNSALNLQGEMYKADKGLEASRYTADKGLEGENVKSKALLDKEVQKNNRTDNFYRSMVEDNKADQEALYKLQSLTPSMRDQNLYNQLIARMEQRRRRMAAIEESLLPDEVRATGDGSGGINLGAFDTKKTPARATGGSTHSSQPYLVGEEGPELFVPEQNGTIIPNPKTIEKNPKKVLANLKKAAPKHRRKALGGPVTGGTEANAQANFNGLSPFDQETLWRNLPPASRSILSKYGLGPVPNPVNSAR